MSRLYINTPNRAQKVVEDVYKDMERRIIASPPGICPLDVSSAFLKMSQAQSCGKCVPCRVGLVQLSNLIDGILEGDIVDIKTIDLIERTANSIANSADCAIGYEAAHIVLKGIEGFKEDYEEHILHNRCKMNSHTSVPCVSMCPAGVDIPGYMALVREERYADAVRLIRKDNPFPSVCGLICEHPCENRCRRTIMDAPLNIRGIKRVAVERAGNVPAPECGKDTGKKVAVIGGGPAGLTCAYYLRLMGHQVTVFEKNEKLGGMLRYGIPNYRLPRVRLDEEINTILSTGVEVKRGIEIGKDITLEKLSEDFDSTYITIGAHTDKKLRLENEDAKGVLSAVEILHYMGQDNPPDFTGKKVVVIGGGNVAMDVVRTSIRLNAEKVTCAYRRRIEDMTALPEEIEGAIAEGVEMRTLISPNSIEVDEDNHVKAMTFKKQIIGEIKNNRASVYSADEEIETMDCDILIVAIGQDIESENFKKSGIPVKRGTIDALMTADFEGIPGVFAGGDCVTGPATVIKAIEGGKVAAKNIDDFLGFDHKISVDVEIPDIVIENKKSCARVNMKEREATERKFDLDLIELCMTDEEAVQEAGRCLRCDRFGYGNFRGGRDREW